MRNVGGFFDEMSEDGYNQLGLDSLYGYIVQESMTAFSRKKGGQVAKWLADFCDVYQRLRRSVGEDPQSDVVQIEIARHYDVVRSIWGIIGGQAITAAEYKNLAGIYKRSYSLYKKPDLRFSRFMRMAMKYFINTRLSKKKGR